MRTLVSCLPVLLFLLMSIGLQCQEKNSPQAFDLSQPRVMRLSPELKEISGIVAGDNSIYAISDDNGQLYRLGKQDGKITAQWTFAGRDDYEDVVLVGNQFFVLNSNGNILHFSLPPTGPVVTKEWKFPFGKGNEFEILYYDTQQKQLVMVCKECKDDGKNSLSVYTIDPANGTYNRASFRIDGGAITGKGKNGADRLKPSAAAVNPATGITYMISSINKAFFQVDGQGKVDAIQPLKRALFGQPEGLTFTPDGELFISNEGGDGREATLMQFKPSAH